MTQMGSTVIEPPRHERGAVGRWQAIGRDHRRGNLAAHLLRSSVRVAALLGVDLTGFVLTREAVRTVRSGAFGGWLQQLALEIMPDAAVSGLELGVAVILALFFVRSYRGADLWRQPVRLLSGVGAGVAVALYAEMWAGSGLVACARGLLIWLVLGLVLVALRSLLVVVVRRLPQSPMTRKVLEIRSEGSSRHVDLGPGYQRRGVLGVQALSEDADGLRLWLEKGIDTILVSGELPASQFGRLADFALTHGCYLLTVPRAPELVAIHPRRVWVQGQALTEFTAPSLRASQLVLKRLCDLTGACLLLAIFSPVLLLIAVCIRLDSRGPVLFRQWRTGVAGRPFQMLKFRSMRPDAEKLLRQDALLYERYVQNDFKLPAADDPRITSVGRILRRTSMDELPQLFNVLMGEMSLVGPRPVEEDQIQMYESRIPIVLSVKPGVTGLWQVSGRSTIAFPQRAEMDVEYIRHWSLLQDMWILLMTVPAVLMKRGAH